jgi:hypothetical protein
LAVWINFFSIGGSAIKIFMNSALTAMNRMTLNESAKLSWIFSALYIGKIIKRLSECFADYTTKHNYGGYIRGI